jgi:hypothetical protein
MVEISDLPRGPSDPDWDEAWRLATNLIAARISGGEAYTPSYQDVLGWAVRGQSAEVAAKGSCTSSRQPLVLRPPASLSQQTSRRRHLIGWFGL